MQQQPGMKLGMVMGQQPQQQVQMAPVNNYVVQQQVVTQQVIQQVVVQAPAANNTWEYDQAPSIKYGVGSLFLFFYFVLLYFVKRNLTAFFSNF